MGIQIVYATFSKHRKYYFWLELLFMSVHINLEYKIRIRNKFNISKSFKLDVSSFLTAFFHNSSLMF